MFQKLLAQQEREWMAVIQRFSLFCEREKLKHPVETNPLIHREDVTSKTEKELTIQLQKLFLPKPLRRQPVVAPRRPLLVQQQHDEDDDENEENTLSKPEENYSNSETIERIERLQALYASSENPRTENLVRNNESRHVENYKKKNIKIVHFANNSAEEDVARFFNQPRKELPKQLSQAPPQSLPLLPPQESQLEELSHFSTSTKEVDHPNQEEILMAETVEDYQEFSTEDESEMIDHTEQLLIDSEKVHLRFIESQGQIGSSLQTMSQLFLEHSGPDQIMSIDQVDKILSSLREKGGVDALCSLGQNNSNSMAQCKQQIQYLSKQLILLQRSEHASFRLLHSLRGQAERSATLLEALLCEAVSNVHNFDFALKRAKKSNAQHLHEEAKLHAILQEVEQAIRRTREQLENQRLGCKNTQKAVELLEDEISTEELLLQSLSAHRSTLTSPSKQALEEILQLQKEVVTSRVLNREFPEKITVYRLSLLRSCVVEWKKKVSFYKKKRWSKSSLLKKLLKRWKQYAMVSVLSKRLVRHRQKASKKRYWLRWKKEYSLAAERDNLVSSFLAKRNLKTAFTTFRQQIQKLVMERIVDDKHRFALTLFSVVRILRAWRRLAVAGRNKFKVLHQSIHTLRLRFAWNKTFLRNDALRRQQLALVSCGNHCYTLYCHNLVKHQFRQWLQKLNLRNSFAKSQSLRMAFSRWHKKSTRQQKRKSLLLQSYASAVSNIFALRRALKTIRRLASCRYRDQQKLNLANFHYLRRLASMFLTRRRKHSTSEIEHIFNYSMRRKKILCRYRSRQLEEKVMKWKKQNIWNRWRQQSQVGRYFQLAPLSQLLLGLEEQERDSMMHAGHQHSRIVDETVSAILQNEPEDGPIGDHALALHFSNWKQVLLSRKRENVISNRNQVFQLRRHMKKWYSLCLRVWCQQYRQNYHVQNSTSLEEGFHKKQEMEEKIKKTREDIRSKERFTELLRVELAEVLDVQGSKCNEFSISHSDLDQSLQVLEKQKQIFEATVQCVRNEIACTSMQLEALGRVGISESHEQVSLTNVSNPFLGQYTIDQEEVRQAKHKLEQLNVQKMHLQTLISEEKQALESIYSSLANSVLSLESRLSERVLLSRSLHQLQEYLHQIFEQICHDVNLHEQEVTHLEKEKAECTICLQYILEQEKTCQYLLENIRMKQKQVMQRNALEQKFDFDRKMLASFTFVPHTTSATPTYTTANSAPPLPMKESEEALNGSASHELTTTGEELQLNHRIQELTFRLKQRIQQQQQQISLV